MLVTKKNRKIFSLVIICIILIILIFCFCLLIDNIKYEVARDEKINSPNKKYTILLRYDYVSRPYIFKNNKVLFKYNGSGFNEKIEWNIKWLSNNQIMLYYDSSDDKYDEVYYITID